MTLLISAKYDIVFSIYIAIQLMKLIRVYYLKPKNIKSA